MLQVAVLGSTRGTDLQSIIDAIESGRLTGIQIALVISNKEKAHILVRAQKHNIKTIYLNPELFSDRNSYDQAILQILTESRIELVLLIGYMKIITPDLLRPWQNRIMNIHPSLLPAYAGQTDLNIHQAVINRGCKITGATLIFIDEGADTGPIISQRAITIDSSDTPESLKVRVQALEQEMLIEALEWYRDGRIQVTRDHKVMVSL